MKLLVSKSPNDVPTLSKICLLKVCSRNVKNNESCIPCSNYVHETLKTMNLVFLAQSNTEILGISPYSVRMRENADQKNSEYVHFSRSVSKQQMTGAVLMANYLLKVSKKDTRIKSIKIIHVSFLIILERYSLIGISLGAFVIMMIAFT